MTLIDLKPAATGPDYMRLHRIDITRGLPWSMDRRALDEPTVAMLMESMRLTGLKQPIVVYVSTPGMPPKLVAGRHRLAAAIRLGWTEIDAVELPHTGDDAATLIKMTEIAENLHRRELSTAEKAELVEEWRRLTVAKVPQVAAPRGGEQPRDRGHRKTAKALGVSAETVQRAEQIAALPLETRERAKAEKWPQKRLLDEARKSRPASRPEQAAEPVPARPASEPDDPSFGALLMAWDQAPSAARYQLVARLGLIVPKGVLLGAARL